MCHPRASWLGLVALAGMSGCHRPLATIRIEPVPDSSQIVLRTGTAVGDLRLWLPEAITSNEGFSAVYPRGQWRARAGAFSQHVEPVGGFGPGNFVVRDDTVECAGITVPRDQPVAWTATLSPHGDRVDFAIVLHNLGHHTIHSAGAAVCLKFVDKTWWTPDHVYVRSSGSRTTLAELGEHAGRASGFEAYLLAGQSYDNHFYQEFWGFNSNRLDAAEMVSVHQEADLSVTIAATRAVFLHSNRRNPCTDVMLALGDLAPGERAASHGSITLRRTRTASRRAVAP